MSEAKRYLADTNDLPEFDPKYYRGEHYGLSVVVLASDYDALAARVAELEAMLTPTMPKSWTAEEVLEANGIKDFMRQPTAYAGAIAIRLLWLTQQLEKARGAHADNSRPSHWCKHDDGDCHEDDPCDNCPVYRKAGKESSTRADAGQLAAGASNEAQDACIGRAEDLSDADGEKA